MSGNAGQAGARSTATRPGRAQSSPIGVILIIAITIAGSTLVVALGSQAVSDTQTHLNVDRAENTMTQLDSQAAMVALGNSEVQQVSLQQDSARGYAVHNESGWMNVSYKNTSSGDVTTIYNKSMGAVVYQNGDRNVTYQGGGVWKERDGDSVMVSPPEFHFRNATLTLPMVQVRGQRKLSGMATVTKNSSTSYFPNETINEDFVNPLEKGKVNVTVQSKYYKGWGTYFEQRTDGEVRYDHDRNRASLILVSPIDKQKVTSAAASLSASGSFELQGTAFSTCGAGIYTNSYNSSGTTDDCLDQAATGSLGNDGDIVYGDNVDISYGAGTSDIRGDVVSGDTVEVATGGAGQPDVYGHINYTNQCNPSVSDCEDRVMAVSGGEVTQISGVDSVSSINSLVQSRISDAVSSNDNGATGNVSGNALDYGNQAPSDTVELHAGTYYLTELTPTDDQTVILNTTEGDVTIVVEENVAMAGSGSTGATIDVVGDGVAKMYVGGTGGHSTHFAMEKNTEVTNDGDDADQFRLYGRDNLSVAVGDDTAGNPAKFVGVVYAPPGDSGSARVDIEGGEIFGGVLTGTTTIDGGSIHYDEALQSTKVMSRDDKIVKLTYLHVSVNRVNVTSG